MGGITEVLASESLALDFKLLCCRKMFSSWDKVRSFLETMDISDFHSPLPFSSTSSSSSSFDSILHPLSVDAKSWEIGEKTTQKILSIIQPTIDSENRRNDVIEYLQGLIGDAFGIKVLPFGSVPLKTYLPHGDIDLTAISHYGTVEDLAPEIFRLLNKKENNNSSLQVRDVVLIPAQVKVVKCTVDDIAVDISFNQTAGLCTLYFLEQVDQFIDRDHLFKRSVILIKAWCYYESRLLGGFHGLISTYALETMVLHVLNLFHSLLQCPLGVLYKFLQYYSTFDWKSYCIGIDGLVLISSLPNIEVIPMRGFDELLLTEEFLRSSRQAFFSSTGVVGAFPVKNINILDPLRNDNNLGRSVSRANFYRIKSALSYGAQRLGDVLILPPEKIGVGLEKFFNNTLERNGRGRRVDVLVPVPIYGAEECEIFVATNDDNDIYTGSQYGLWFDDSESPYPGWFTTQAAHQGWYNGWGDVCHFDRNAFCYVEESTPSSVDSPGGLHQIYATSVEENWKSRGILSSADIPNASSAKENWKPSVEKWRPSGEKRKPAGDKWKSKGQPSCSDSPRGYPVVSPISRHLDSRVSFEEKRRPRYAFSADSPRGHRPDKAASVEEKWGSDGLSPYIPLSAQLVQRNMILEQDGTKWERSREDRRTDEDIYKEVGSWDSQAYTSTESNLSSNLGEGSCSVNFLVDDFPLLPGSKPIPIKMSSSVAYNKCHQVKAGQAALVSVDSTELQSFKASSPISLSLSEAGKQSDSEGSLSLTSISSTVAAEGQDLYKGEDKLVLAAERLQLTDEKAFPPLGRPADPVKPVIKLNKKEFPPLGACPKSHKNIWRKNCPKEVKNGLDCARSDCKKGIPKKLGRV